VTIQLPCYYVTFLAKNVNFQEFFYASVHLIDGPGGITRVRLCVRVETGGVLLPACRRLLVSDKSNAQKLPESSIQECVHFSEGELLSADPYYFNYGLSSI